MPDARDLIPNKKTGSLQLERHTKIRYDVKGNLSIIQRCNG